jgi:hypothetical protein
MEIEITEGKVRERSKKKERLMRRHTSVDDYIWYPSGLLSPDLP